MSRLAIRWKVTLAFTLALLVVLGAVGAFLYLRFGVELEQGLDRALRARAAELSALVERSPERLARVDPSDADADERPAQLVDAQGRVVAATRPAGAPLIDSARLRRVRDGATVVFDRPGDAALDESVRIRAVPVRSRGAPAVLVVGASLDEPREALFALLRLELFGLGAALLATGLAGYLVAGVALRPVEAMRREAEAISGRPDRRLPVPAIDDELGRLGATLNAMLDRLERASASERRFIADASHELRTPLTVLRSEVEVSLLEDGGRDELRAALESAGQEADRLCRLAEDLLVLARTDDGRLRLRSEPVDVEALLDGVAERARRAPEAAGRRIAVEVAGESDLVVTADAQRLEQALGNLVDNALRHGAGDVELSAAATPGSAVELSVRDHGPGLTDAFAERAFERFARADAGRSAGGTGLGLAIVRALVDAHGGTIAAEAASPGTRMRILLPGSANAHRASATMTASRPKP